MVLYTARGNGIALCVKAYYAIGCYHMNLRYQRFVKSYTNTGLSNLVLENEH